jgi:hypothetical protein
MWRPPTGKEISKHGWLEEMGHKVWPRVHSDDLTCSGMDNVRPSFGPCAGIGKSFGLKS